MRKERKNILKGWKNIADLKGEESGWSKMRKEWRGNFMLLIDNILIAINCFWIPQKYTDCYNYLKCVIPSRQKQMLNYCIYNLCSANITCEELFTFFWHFIIKQETLSSWENIVNVGDGMHSVAKKLDYPCVP